jgi:hypothetical protein
MDRAMEREDITTIPKNKLFYFSMALTTATISSMSQRGVEAPAVMPTT